MEIPNKFWLPNILNFGRNYEGARDENVYLYSHDSDSAYDPADAMVLARVHKTQLRERNAYRFFAGLDAHGEPRWTAEIRDRKPIFEFPGNCYRSGVSYYPALKRYLWVQVLPQSTDARGPRFQGGFGVYEAPEPWGPWSTVYFTREWDTGPGETASFPTKWMTANGREMHLVFSSDDHFSVRRAAVVSRRRALTLNGQQTSLRI